MHYLQTYGGLPRPEHRGFSVHKMLEKLSHLLGLHIDE